MRIFVFSHLIIACLISNILRRSLSSDCNHTPVKRLFGEETSIDDSPVASSSGFQNVEKVGSSSNENLQEQSFPRVMKKRNAVMSIQNFLLNSRFIESFFDRSVHLSDILPLTHFSGKWSGWEVCVNNSIRSRPSSK
ncbi:hypothetical protein NPIL_137461 [Nephila pilipes]|uniref:Uncharacterized protein n=1 Tax=Nephila pilipes TaxID=299642 RepID=A0A8X6TZY0_NEPPI|nr:hypothetical protein NPIL_137461 [Nephila pilipes]